MWMYFRSVDDTFIMCTATLQVDSLLGKFNAAHQNIILTVEHEDERKTALLDMELFSNVNGTLIRTVLVYARSPHI